ncbi:hypothetical protein [Ruegeria arenilitoris]|uniref:hypothetical protein n=1 Tax=Ruegeria arenilitoris TaxID=1173585 RepID=UPI00147F3771|nr:hypothetical protein [Ruegeria arenilitoris]
MTLVNSAKCFLVVSLLATSLPVAAIAKPNGYPGENSTYNPDPAEVVKRKAERAKRIEARKKRREEKRLERLNRKKNRSN